MFIKSFPVLLHLILNWLCFHWIDVLWLKTLMSGFNLFHWCYLGTTVLTIELVVLVFDFDLKILGWNFCHPGPHHHDGWCQTTSNAENAQLWLVFLVLTLFFLIIGLIFFLVLPRLHQLRKSFNFCCVMRWHCFSRRGCVLLCCHGNM